ncbi:elongation factor 1-gamma [Saccoglossus kowalevskii]|uniref:Elongation factor 1-gamma n=1 Tax=Saccoglossus kowalevskii TaxID=10224 RepID=A0ABM0GGW9_SACKO|nr:elongation factor 1-gamma [Saccoglossus kowalevskii]
MAAGTLYTYPDNFRAQKIQIAAAYSGVSLKVVSEPPEFKLGETNKTDAFLSKFPVGKVPAFEAADGTCIFESNAIAYSVSNDTLHGCNRNDAVQVLQWIGFADNEILPASATWVFPTLGIMQYNKQNTERAKEEIKKALNILNNHLKTRTYLVGERVTLADISVASTLLMLYKQVLEPAFRKPYSNVNRWFTTLINQTEFKSVLGDVSLCEKMAQFDTKKFQELHGGAGKKDKKKEEKKKPEKKAPKEKAPKEDEEDDVPKKPKKKDPFGDLPKSDFNLDEFKRTISNCDTYTVALPYFWEHFDKEGYSIWYSEYLYPEELSKIYMSCNLVGGMMQRLEKLKKNCYGSVLIFGEDDNSSISGIWFWRGQELVFPLSDDWQIDYESYSWKKLDPDAEETKTLVKEYFAWEGDFEGKKVNQGKVFK